MVARLSLIALVIPSLLAAQEESPPLFTSAETLHLTLVADFNDIHKDRKEDSEYEPAELFFGAAGDDAEGLAVKVKTRGRFRLQRSTCKYPPLRINLPEKKVEGTVFEGQDRLKLVTHCQDRDSYERNLVEEYLVYRIYNLLSDISFRVRLARITYVDARGKDDPVVRYGFLIEDEDAMAARLGGTLVEAPSASPYDYDDEGAALVTVFQYMVGNTDFSLVYFHNVKLFRSADYTYFPIAYDFDWSGFVDAPYARPDPMLAIRSVRQRVYRGFCRPDVDFSTIFAIFAERRAAIDEMLAAQEGLDQRSRDRLTDYLDGFFETIGKRREADREIIGACRRI
ncbi:MAG: hypothetical protein BMS9Abin29_0412 [Gemmatimonadota bacterium]|nr:MAG: hypothetical protein BMS9Abin29_0412 [Gemmatimonadota bacterium]